MANQDLEVGKTHNECISARERLKLKNMNEHTKETQGNEAITSYMEMPNNNTSSTQ